MMKEKAEKHGQSKKNGKAAAVAAAAHKTAAGLARVSPLTQDPHAIRDNREKVLEVAIGHEVRAFRKKLGITVADVAAATDISVGMLSKIENGNTSPSLTTLQTLSRALGVPITSFFRRFEEEHSAVFVKAGEGVDVERRGTRAGHQYNLLGHIGSNTAGVVVEPYLITLTEDSDVFPAFQHGGLEFLYMLEGEVVYRHGNNLYRMTAGDSLFFDADAPHGPEELTRLPIRFLSIISYPRGHGED
ncbi:MULTISPECIES: XRE family transcriptional regulator [unclassified Sinorhizobium]|uniref:helix-turn-helix domain-containing protein n=1 Tax=unclassified Sinorhizobium TaxID=2613772 RepID=UPI0024C35BC9|nr:MULTISPECIES: XRE family transcriptional regulator [unclassified Sinorhizobium]MDK1374036.1 XRE family transcriptional regulator [Sinorhizobium sp. 6-70]MDK1480699.1 XRE family transcriptional regulator [Sinorhizobium sp. 6-117]